MKHNFPFFRAKQNCKGFFPSAPDPLSPNKFYFVSDFIRMLSVCSLWEPAQPRAPSLPSAPKASAPWTDGRTDGRDA